jgi:hypothetical protein
MIDKETEMSSSIIRQNTNTLLELVEEGILDPVWVVTACLKWMSDKQVGEMAEANGFFPKENDLRWHRLIEHTIEHTEE